MFVTIPGLQRIIPLRSMLRRARDTPLKLAPCLGPRSARHFAARRRTTPTKVAHPADLSLLRRPSHNGMGEPFGRRPEQKRIFAYGCFSAAVPGGGQVRENLRRSAGVEETRLYRRRQVQGDVRALAQGPQRLLGRGSQAPALVQG